MEILIESDVGLGQESLKLLRHKPATNPNGARRRKGGRFDSYFCEIMYSTRRKFRLFSPLVSLCLSLAGDLPLQEAMHCSDRIRPVHLLTAQRKGLINAPDIDN